MIKDVLVHLDGSADDEERLRYAESIASESEAHVTGLLTNSMPDYAGLVSVDGSAGAAAILAGLEEDAQRQGEVTEKRLAERLARLGVPSEVRRIDDIPSRLAARAATEARWADIFVLSRPYRDQAAPLWDNLFETVLFEGGRGVLVVPPHRPPADAVRRILVCWRDTREASRAIAQAMPLIEKATRTAILAIDPESDHASVKQDPTADIAKHLSRHGTRVETSVIESEGREAVEIILEQARRISADLIVMGAYGHSRAREWMLGGATRDMLESSEFPILMAH